MVGLTGMSATPIRNAASETAAQSHVAVTGSSRAKGRMARTNGGG